MSSLRSRAHWRLQTHDDRMAGPSAKGGPVSEPPAREEIEAALWCPSDTFRLAGLHPDSLTDEETTALGLPGKPDWMYVFEGQPPPPPPGGASIEAIAVPRRLELWADPDADGRFRFEHVPAGTYLIVAARSEYVNHEHCSGWPLVRELAVAVGETVQLDLDLPTGPTLAFSVPLPAQPAGDRLEDWPHVHLSRDPWQVHTQGELARAWQSARPGSTLSPSQSELSATMPPVWRATLHDIPPGHDTLSIEGTCRGEICTPPKKPVSR